MELLKNIAEMILSLIIKKEVSVEIPFDGPPQTEPIESEKIAQPAGIDWTNPKDKVTEHFTVADCITLHAWARLATVEDGLTDEVKANIIQLCQKIEQVRVALNCPIIVHCIFRSVQYNEQVLKSLPNDVHSMGMAIDFDCNENFTIQQIKDIVEPRLEEWGLRMEKGTTTWIHLDTHSVGPSGRYFTA